MKLKGLKFIRKTFGLTMKELSEELGVSSNTINLWEKGTLDVTEERLRQLGEFFGLENTNILLYDFNNEENKHTSKMILAVETARLEYKIKKYNANYIENFELDNINKIHLLEDNRELFENLEGGVACLADELNESTFNEIGSIIEQILIFLLSDKKNIDEFKLWYNIITFNPNKKYGDTWSLYKYSAEDYIKLDILRKYDQLMEIEEHYKEKDIEYELSDHIREY